MEAFNTRYWHGPELSGNETRDEVYEKNRTHLLRMSLENFANVRSTQTAREEANYHKTHSIARRLWKNPRRAIRPKSFAAFMEHFQPWRAAVVYAPPLRDTLTATIIYLARPPIIRWDRRKMVERFRKTGERRGFWGSELGYLTSLIFPQLSGMTMKEAPPYYHVFTEQDLRLLDNFVMFTSGQRYKHKMFWFSVGFLATAANALYASRMKWTKVKVPQTLLLAVFTGAVLSIIPGALYLRLRWRYYDGLDHLLRSRDSFVAARARLLFVLQNNLSMFTYRADDLFWPPTEHNRCYFDDLPRDRWDELVWSLDDEKIRVGNFNPHFWGFALRPDDEFVIPESAMLPSRLTMEQRIFRFKELCYQFVGKGFDFAKHIMPPPKVRDEIPKVTNYRIMHIED